MGDAAPSAENVGEMQVGSQRTRCFMAGFAAAAGRAVAEGPLSCVPPVGALLCSPGGAPLAPNALCCVSSRLRWLGSGDEHKQESG